MGLDVGVRVIYLRMLCLLVWQIVAYPAVLFAGGESGKLLPLPDANHSLETLTPNIRDIFLNVGTLFQIPLNHPYVITTPFSIDAKSNMIKFGKLSDSRRIELPAKPIRGPWEAIEVNSKGLLLLNGNILSITKLNSDGIFDAETDLMYDGILPAADSRGEPPQFEINQVRAAFVKQLKNTSGTRLTSFRRIPKSWKLAAKNSFLALSTIKNHPILLVSCPSDDIEGCKIQRICQVEGYQKKFSGTLTGLALHPEKTVIFIADQGAQKIHVLNFSSCFHISYLDRIAIPAKLKTLSSIFIDEELRLWISTIGRDDYNNASVFYWDKGDWTDL